MAETSGLRQFVILLYKGLLLRKRHYIVTFFELVIPILIASIPAIIMSEYAAPMPRDAIERKRSDLWVNYTTYEPFNPFKLPYSYYTDDTEFVFVPAYQSTEEFVNKSIDKYRNESGYTAKISTTSFDTEEQLEVYCTNRQRYSSYSTNIIGTVFNNFKKDGVLPPSLDYKIRYGKNQYFYTQTKYRVNGPQYSNAYVSSLFLGWQSAIEETFIDQKMNENNVNFDYKISMQRFPYPDHLDTRNSLSVISIVPWCICSGVLIFIINIVRRIIEEKANGSKELLKMMGMSDYVYWLATFTNYFIVAFYLVLVITIIYKAPLKYSYVFIKSMDFMLLFILLLVFMSSLILFCMAFSVFYTRAIYAVIALMVIYYVSFSSFFSTFFVTNTELNYLPLPLIQKLGICLLPTGSILTLFTLISFYENSGEGANWSNMTEFSLIPDLNILMILLTMLFSCALYIFIIWYFDKVWPWQPGVPQPFYFPFTRSYWCGAKANDPGDEIPLVSQSDSNSDFFEVEPRNDPGVIIKNLSKEFRSGLQTKLAVNDVSLNIFKGQITALLGHNGAGKTTTINILTGLYSPSKGTASINGLDILKETHRARRGLGVCPQHNVLYDTLTVEEHLRIYAAMKGVPWGNLAAEATSVLEILKLTNKRFELTKNLSGGMKRKLSLAIAIVGGSKVLFLDEPTSGLDVEARRSVWDALLNIRHDRTIVLTTHYMEEADILGDRIAIMAEGEVQCCGSPIFLKQKFGTGYHLHIVKDTNFDQSQLTSLLERYNPGVTLGNELDKEISFKLSSDSSENFGDMFEQLEIVKQKLGIVSFGITVTTMEDVFLNVANISDMKYKLQPEKTANGAAVEFEDVYGESSRAKLRPTLPNQLLGLLLKRMHYSKRHWGIFIVQLIIPFLLLCVLLFTIRSISDMNKQTYDPLKLDLNEVYGRTEAFYFQRKKEYSPISDTIINVFESNKAAVTRVDDPTRYVLDYGKSSISKYFKILMVGGAVDKFSNGTWNLTAWYNGEPYHTAPMSLLMMHDVVLKKVAKGGSITLTNAPLPETRSAGRGDQSFMTERIMSGTLMPLVLGFIVAGYVLVPTHERTTKAKLLQIMSGVHPVLYWISMFMWDFLVYSAICVLMIIPYAIFSHYAFFGIHSDAIGTALLLMLLYGWASIPFSYLISFIFNKGNTGFSVMVGISSIFGVGVGTTLRFFQYTISTFNQGQSVKTIDNLVWLFRLLPTFSISAAFQNLFGLAFHNSLCESISPDVLRINCESPSLDQKSPLFQCCKGLCGNHCLTEISPLTWDQESCGRDLFFLFLDGAIHFCLLILIETTYMASFKRIVIREFTRLWRRSPMPVLRDAAAEDSEVMAEEQKIRSLLMTRQDAGDEALAVVDLSKSFKNFYAVDHLAFGIHKEECFGLLGVNGAGKTTTFRMLTGDCYPSDGNALIQNVSVRTNLKKFQSFLGYCPQFDALIDRLTGREMLQLFARLRGLSGSELDKRVDKMIKMTDLTAYADKQSQFYSGGNKRKLSVGIALIGSPPLLLLDEPTAGVDPVSRRKIWNILSQARNNTGASVILTTHSMEESEALCSRLAIMVNGRFRCLGSIQQLKSKYGQGYTLIIKMKRERQGDVQAMSNIKTHVEGQMPGAQLKDDHQGMLQYHIIDPSVTLSSLFKFMSQMKTQFDLEDYLISDTSLEQIFLTFARSQRIQA